MWYGWYISNRWVIFYMIKWNVVYMNMVWIVMIFTVFIWYLIIDLDIRWVSIGSFNLVMVFLRSILRLMDFGVRICDISSLTVFFEYFIILIVLWCWIFLRFCLLIVINWSFGLMWSLRKVGFFGVIVLINILRFILLEYFSFIIVMLKLILGVFFRIIS